MKEVPAVAERLGLVALELAALPSSRRIGRIRDYRFYCYLLSRQ
jgi:hypothetical protein